MTRLQKILLLILLPGLATQATAETDHWNTITLNTSAGGYDWYLDTEQRMDKTFDDMHTFYVALGARRKISSHNSLGLEYHWEDAKRNGQWRSENRYSLLLTDSRRFGAYGLATRYKLESRDKPTGYELRSRLRFRLSTSLGDWTPWGQVELAYNHSGSRFSENRYSLGVDYPLTETLKVSGYYMYRRTGGGGSWNDVNIVGTRFSYSF